MKQPYLCVFIRDVILSFGQRLTLLTPLTSSIGRAAHSSAVLHASEHTSASSVMQRMFHRQIIVLAGVYVLMKWTLMVQPRGDHRGVPCCPHRCPNCRHAASLYIWVLCNHSWALIPTFTLDFEYVECSNTLNVHKKVMLFWVMFQCHVDVQAGPHPDVETEQK